MPGTNREDDVWFIVKREINNVEKYYLEKLADFSAGNTTIGSKYLDSYLEYDGIPTSTLTGLDSLEGEVVDIIADGTVHPSLEVSSGTIDLNNNYSVVTVGLPFISEVWPLLGDIPTKEGTTFGREQRILNLYLDFYRTLGVYVGRYDTEDGESEEEIAFRVPGDLMGVAIPLFTGIVDYSFPEGYDNQSRFFIRQKQPLPLTVRGITDVVEVYE